MKVLNVGCGGAKIHPMFDGWDETRLDIDPAVKPDIVMDILDMSVMDYDSYDAVYSSHNLEHLYYHEVPVALSQFLWVLKPGGIVFIGVPNLEEVAKHIAKGGWSLEDILYVSPSGPISAIDCVYGFRKAIRSGNKFYAHKTGFSPETLKKRLHEAGFYKIEIKTTGVDMWASGVKK